MIGQVWTRLKLLYAQGVGKLIGDDTIQASLLDGETLTKLRRVEPYGFSYRPLPGCEPHLVFPAGDRSYGVALVIADRRYQLVLAPGEVALHDDQGNHVWLKRGGVIEVTATTMVVATTPLLKTTGDAQIGGNLVVLGHTQSNAGFYGDGGGSAEMRGGARVSGEFRVNDKDVSDSHTHTSTPPGSPTSGVN